MRVRLMYILVLATTFLQACKKEDKLVPPLIQFTSVRVLDPLASNPDTTYSNVDQVSVNNNALIELTCKTQAMEGYEQMDVIVYGMAKDNNNIPLDTAYLLNSVGYKTNLLGNLSMGWPNTSFREGFMSENSDSLVIIMPKITQQSSMVMYIEDKKRLGTTKTFIVNLY